MANIYVDTRMRTKCVRRFLCGVWLWCLLTFLVNAPCTFAKSKVDSVFIFPSEDVNVRYGEDLEIFCTAGTNYTSRDISFRVGNELLDYEIVNSTTIRLFKKQLKEHLWKSYYCKNNKTNQSTFVSVLVAAPLPGDVTDFDCISYNFEVFNCSWTSQDTIFTNYNVTTVVDNIKVKKPCIASVPFLGSRSRYCSWNTTSDPRYRQTEAKLDFILFARNGMGNKTQNFTVDHYSVVKPNAPEELKNVSTTPSSVLLSWRVPLNIPTFLKHVGWKHKIEYQIAKIDATSYFRQVDTSWLSLNSSIYRYNLTDLPYAHMQYGVRVYIKSAAAISDRFWSDFASITVKTASERPRRPPDTAAGAFNQNTYTNGRVLYIYWKQLEEYEEAGANFTYKVIMTHGDKTEVQFPDKRKSMGYLHLEKATLDAIHITIFSYNQVGSSVGSSYLYIPPESETKSPSLKSFTKLAYENGTYELSWVVTETTSIDNYTLFWCHHNTTYICNGRINFTTLHHSKNKHVIDLPRDYRYQFAISANKRSGSSGMTWAKCDLSKDGIAMFGFPVQFVDHDAPGKTSVKLRWSMECALKKGIITGYNITYCPVIGTGTVCDSTVGNETSVIVDDPDKMDVEISKLRPYTTYQFKMALNTSTYGPKMIENATIAITTLEDTPTNPRNIEVDDVRNDSLTISWDPPLYVNGPISNIKYVIYNFTTPMFEVKNNSYKRTNTTLTKLIPFTNYSLSVSACHAGPKLCSEPVEFTLVRTRIGKPSKLNTPVFKDNYLAWQPPDIAGGTVDEYQIRVIKDGKPEVIKVPTEPLTFALTSCEGGIQNETYEVRAVNFDTHVNHGALAITKNVKLTDREQNDNVTLEFEGEWSDVSSVLCKSRNNLFLFFIIMGVLAVIGFACVLLKGYKKLRKMGDIKPEFPKGLFIPEKDISKNWNPIGGLYPSEKESKPTSDEMLLLPNSNSKTSVSTPAMKQVDNDNCGSSDHTDSTALSEASQGGGERQNSISDDDSHSSMHLVVQPIKGDDNAILGGISSIADTDSSRENSPYPNTFKKNSSGYVQPPTSIDSPPSLATVQPASSSYVKAGLEPCIFTSGAMPSGRINQPTPSSFHMRPEDEHMRSAMNFPILGPSPTKNTGPGSLPTIPTLPPPTKHGADSSYIPLQSLDTLPSHKPVRNTVPFKQPVSSGYHSLEDAVINKHLKNIMSGVQPVEESAILDPTMSPDAYCRFSWSTDPANDNLHSLLASSTINPSKN